MDSKTFETIPAAQTICLEMGHAFGIAKFGSQCPFLGSPIPAGTRVRSLTVTDPRLATALSTATGLQWSASALCPGREGAQTTHAGHSVRVYRDPAGWAILVSSRLGWTNDARRRVTGFAGRGWRERLASHVAECFRALELEVVQ